MQKHKLRFKYHSPRNDRIKNKGKNGVTTFEYFWFMEKTKKWEHVDSEAFELHRSGGYCSHQPCNSFRKFKRILRKNPELIGKLIYCTKYYNSKKDYDYDIESIL